MPNGVRNWTYKDVKSFIRKFGFTITRTKGSHHHFNAFVDGTLRMVTVPFHANKSIAPRTLESIIAQSGIDKKKWLE